MSATHKPNQQFNHLATTMPIKFHQLKVATVRYETESAVQIGFKIPPEKEADFRFDPGQYLTISLTIDGKKVRRAYSICSAADEPIISILVKRVEKGLVSNYLNDKIKVGQTFDVLPPNGHFKLTLEKNHEKHYYFFGAGSGITPLMSMITSLLENDDKAFCHLLYGNRDENNIIFRKKIDRLELVYKDRFKIKYILSRPLKEKSTGIFNFLSQSKTTWKGEIGRVNKKNIDLFLKEENTKNQEIHGYYICGPGPMIEATYDGLIALEIDKDLILREYFSAPVSAGSDIILESDKRVPINSKVKINLDKKEIELTINDDTNIVQALLDKNIEPPYSCLSGTCSTCMAKLEKGEVEMDVSIGLEDDEKENGFILTCQSHPLTEEVNINYDFR